MPRRWYLLVPVVPLLAVGLFGYLRTQPETLVLTGIVTTDSVVISAQVAGQLGQMRVREGEPVKSGQLLAVIKPDELQADSAYYAHNVAGLSSQVRESEAALRFQERQWTDQVAQAQSTLASMEAQAKAASADADNASVTRARTQDLSRQGIVSPQELDLARTAAEAAAAKREAVLEQVEAQRSAVALARSQADQVAMRRSQLKASEHMQEAAAAQRTKAEVRLLYTEIRAPTDGIVDVRGAREGEFVSAGQPIVTLVNPDDLWVRADLEETYIEGVRVGDSLMVRLPSGLERQGTVFHRGVNAAFATQRDVSRTKRDIRTFEIRLRVPNADRRLAVGMTAYVMLPVR